jgi:methionyl-tRNA synthetase
VWHLLGFQDKLESRGWKRIQVEKVPQGQVLPPPTILFQKIEDSQIEEEIQKLKALSDSKQKRVTGPTLSPLKPQVSIEDVRKLDLRVGVIRQAEAVPKSKKLLKLQVDIGLEQRTIVAGIGESYQAADLVGRSVVVVANLKPATLMGVQSEGMLLAAKLGGQLELVSVETSGPGAEVS